MANYNWMKADDLEDIIFFRTEFKMLIPTEFGGGYIEDEYQDYGHVGEKRNGDPKYDIYELLAFWNNAEGLKYDGDEYPLMKEMDEHTDYNRTKGIKIAATDEHMHKLKYPLKLVDINFEGKYEDLDTYSLGGYHWWYN